MNNSKYVTIVIRMPDDVADKKKVQDGLALIARFTSPA